MIPVLKKEGYQIHNHSIFDFEKIPSTVPQFDQWEIIQLYRRHNIFKKIAHDIGWVFARYLPATKHEDSYSRYGAERDKHSHHSLAAILKTIQLNTPAPMFVYGHLLLPHEPYTYDSAGNKIPNTGKPPDLNRDKAAYVSQLVYTNKLVDTIIESIFLHSKKPFIIILQSDHGYRHEGQTNKNLEFYNLNAMYFFNQDYKLLHDSLSNVNTFRIVLNTFFKKNYPLLKDTSYFLNYK